LGKSCYYLGKGRSFNISDLVGTENIGNFTSENFIVCWTAPSGSVSIYRQEAWQYTNITNVVEFKKNYDSTIGKLLITGGTYEHIQSQAGDDDNKVVSITNTPLVYFVPSGLQ